MVSVLFNGKRKIHRKLVDLLENTQSEIGALPYVLANLELKAALSSDHWTSGLLEGWLFLKTDTQTAKEDDGSFQLGVVQSLARQVKEDRLARRAGELDKFTGGPVLEDNESILILTGLKARERSLDFWTVIHWNPLGPYASCHENSHQETGLRCGNLLLHTLNKSRVCPSS